MIKRKILKLRSHLNLEFGFMIVPIIARDFLRTFYRLDLEHFTLLFQKYLII